MKKIYSFKKIIFPIIVALVCIYVALPQVQSSFHTTADAIKAFACGCGDGEGEGPDGAGGEPTPVVPEPLATCTLKINNKSSATITQGDTVTFKINSQNTVVENVRVRPSQAEISTRNGSTVTAKVTNVNTKKFVVTVQNSDGETADCSANITVNPKPVTPPTPTPVIPVPGCTNSDALNFNPNATENDGSCVFPVTPVIPVPGCTNSDALNFNPNATENDGSCVFPVTPVIPVPGCTNSDALNFNPNATENDGSCVFPVTPNPVDDPVCTLTPVNQTIDEGQSTTLTFAGLNFVSARVDNGINDVTDGQIISVTPVVTTTFIGTVTNAAGVNDTCEATVIVNPVVNPTDPAITIVKRDAVDQDDTQTVAIGGVANFEIVVTNTGNEDLENVVVSDPIEPACNRTIGNLAVGASETYTCATANVQASFTNIANVTGASVVDGASVTDSDPTQVVITNDTNPSITIVKRDAVDQDDTQEVAIGGTANFEIVVTNDGAEDLVNIVVTDPLEPDCNRTIGNLAMGASETYTCATTNVQAAFTNVANVTAASAIDGATVTDSDPTTITIPSTPGVLSCDLFQPNTNLIASGGNFSLQFETTDASDITIRQEGDIIRDNLSGDGSISLTAPVFVSDTVVNFELTASNGTDQVTCTTAITVEDVPGGGGGGGGGGGSSSPRCDFDASLTTIEAGERVTLSWETTRGRELTIFEGDADGRAIFTTDEDDEVDEGSIEVRPNEDTEYTLVVERGRRDRECNVQIEVEGSDVVVIETRSQEPRVAGIALTQVPHTGFEAGPFLTFIFYALLTLWALFVAYVFIMKNRTLTAGAPKTPEEEIYKKKLEMLSRQYHQQNHRW